MSNTGNIAAIIAERDKAHGPFALQASLSQAFKETIRSTPNFAVKLDCDQHEALDMIAHKMARILAGSPNHIDTWDDIAGYALLVANRLRADAERPAA